MTFLNERLVKGYGTMGSMLGLTPSEENVLRRLSSPQNIQTYLEALPFNFEERGETLMSPRRTLKAGKAHCLEGALLAATALWLAGEKPYLMDLKTKATDDEHVVALFKRNGYWGAISKTNHAVLRYRDPVYKSVRELALSYFHEYFLNTTGEKTLISYSNPFDLSKLGASWVTDSKDLWTISRKLDCALHFPLVPKKNKALVRKATRIERDAGALVEWTKTRRKK